MLRTCHRALYSCLLLTLLSLPMGCEEHDHGEMAEVPCDEESRAEDFVEDMEKTGAEGLAVFTLHSIDPNPSDIGDNTWELSVRDAADDSPLSACSLDIRPWMPDHEHGSNNPTGSESEPGSYAVSGLRFIMPGYWENTVTISCSSDEDGEWSDSVIYGFCLEG